jgi:hypothetical protein
MPLDQNAVIEEKLSRPALYRRIPIFQGEVSAVKLATTARITLEKFKNDYKIGGFCNLVEWRCKKDEMEMFFQQKPEIQDYQTLLHENNSFCPSIIASLEQNSNKLSQHLSNLLQLKQDDNGGYSDEQNIYMTDRKIIEYATQHDLPIFY